MRKHLVKIIATFSISASAQSVGVVSSLPAPTDTTHLNEVLVTADKVTPSNSTTAPVHTLSAEKMNATGVNDIGDALRRLPGVNLRDYGGAGGMKTVSIRGLGSQHTGISYDGVPVSNVQSGQPDLARFSLDNVNGITLLIGDGDNIFETARLQSVGSSLNIATYDLPDLQSRRPNLCAKIKLGSFGLVNPSLRFAISNAENLGMSISGDFNHALNNYPFTLENGTEKTRVRRSNSDLTAGHIDWNGIWKPTTGSKLQAKFYWLDSSRHLPGPVIYYNTDSKEQLKESNLFGQLLYQASFGHKWKLKALAKYNFEKTRYWDENPIYPNGIKDNNYLQREEYGSVCGWYAPLKGLSISYALDYWHNSFQSNSDNDGRPYRNSLLQSVALKWKFSRVTAVARGLLSLIEDNNAHLSSALHTRRLSPYLGISVQPFEDQDWHIRASYKDIMRMPTFNELYFDHYGSINLQPENASQYNVGTSWSMRSESWLSNINITADGYLNFVTNKIVALPYNMFVWTMTNLGKVRTFGLDISADLEIRPHAGHSLILTGNYSYQRAATRTDPATADWNKQLPYTPLNSGAAALTWMNPWVNMYVNSTARSSSYSTTINVPSTRISGFGEFGFGFFRDFNFKNQSIQARVDIRNIFDKTYEIVARYPLPGRSIYFMIAYKLN